jgi:hypothetical protein
VVLFGKKGTKSDQNSTTEKSALFFATSLITHLEFAAEAWKELDR